MYGTLRDTYSTDDLRPLKPVEIIVYSVNIVYNTSNFIVRNQTVEPIERLNCTVFYHFFMKTIANNNI